MEITPSFAALLQHFLPVFTAPTFQTFVEIANGWLLSQRHRYITEVIFSGGNVGNGHWCRFHRFFSHASWDIDTLSMYLAKLVFTILAPGATLHWAVDDTLCRSKRPTEPSLRGLLACEVDQFVPFQEPTPWREPPIPNFMPCGVIASAARRTAG